MYCDVGKLCWCVKMVIRCISMNGIYTSPVFQLNLHIISLRFTCHLDSFYRFPPASAHTEITIFSNLLAYRLTVSYKLYIKFHKLLFPIFDRLTHIKLVTILALSVVLLDFLNPFTTSHS